MRAPRFAFGMFVVALSTTACGGTVTPAPVDASAPNDGATDAVSDVAASDVATDTASSKCPDLFQNVPGQACTMPEGVECLGNLGASAGWIRCCGGQWTGPNDAGASLGAPPCP